MCLIHFKITSVFARICNCVYTSVCTILLYTRDIISTVLVLHEGVGYNNTRTSIGGPPTDFKGTYPINAGGSQPVVRQNGFSRFLINKTERSIVITAAVLLLV